MCNLNIKKTKITASGPLDSWIKEHRIRRLFCDNLWSFLQIDASSLIAASVMAAPCALAMAKLVYPEVEQSRFKSQEGIKIACG